MIFELTYEKLLSACQNMTWHREQFAQLLLRSFLQTQLSPQLSNEQLMAHLIAEALLRRLDRHLVTVPNLYLQKFSISQIDVFYTMTQGYPLVALGHRLANQTLHKALQQRAQGSLLDIGIGKGVQLADLLQRLSQQPGELRALKVVGLEPSQESLEHTAQMLEKLRPQLDFSVSFYPMQRLLEQCSESELEQLAQLVGPEPVINSVLTLHHLVGKAGDTEFRTRVLSRLRQKLRPQLVTLVEPSANHDTDQLAARFHACWEHFSTVFELVDEAPIAPEHKFLIKETFFGREIRDIFGTSDAFRCERHEPFDSWMLRLLKAGFEPSPEMVGLQEPEPPHCRALESEGLVRMSYRGLPLVAFFAYRSGQRAR